MNVLGYNSVSCLDSTLFSISSYPANRCIRLAEAEALWTYANCSTFETRFYNNSACSGEPVSTQVQNTVCNLGRNVICGNAWNPFPMRAVVVEIDHYDNLDECNSENSARLIMRGFRVNGCATDGSFSSTFQFGCTSSSYNRFACNSTCGNCTVAAATSSTSRWYTSKESPLPT